MIKKILKQFKKEVDLGFKNGTIKTPQDLAKVLKSQNERLINLGK